MNKQLRRFILGLLGLGALLFGQSLYTAQIQAQQAAQLALTQAGYFLHSLSIGNELKISERSLQEWLNAKKDWPSLLYLAVLDEDGRPKASLRPKPSDASPPRWQRLPVTGRAQEMTVYEDKAVFSGRWTSLPQFNLVDRPMRLEGRAVVLRAVLDLESVRQDWRQHLHGVALFLAASLLLVVALFGAVHRTPLRLLREASKFARSMASRHDDPPLPRHSGYAEIDDLCLALQELQDTLREQRASILSSEHKYKNALDELDAVVFQIDRNLTWNFLSAGWERWTGLDPDTFLGQDFSAAFVASDRERIVRAAQDLMHGERSEYRDEIMLRRIEGSLVEMEIAMHIFTDERGNVLGATGTLSDYAKRQDHELEIARQRRLFQQIIDHLPVSIYVKNEQSDYVLVNAQGARVLGYTPDKMVGKTDRDFLLPDHAAARYLEDREVLRTGITLAREQMISVNGEIRHWLGRKVRLDAGNGNMLILQAFIDITERKKAEIELQRQREFIERVIETDPTLIFVKDEDCRYVMVNTAYAKTFGLSREQFLGKRFDELNHQPEEIAAEAWSDRRVLEQGAETVAEVTITRSNEPRRYFIAIKKPLRMPDGRIHVLGIEQDITELKQKEQALLEQARKVEGASRAKSEFMANMSHEIRTPMNGIIGMTDLALNTPLTEEQRQYLGLARASANSLLAIINEILDFSKIEAGRMTIERVPFAFYDLMSEITKPLALQAHARGLSFFAKIDPDIPFQLMGDPTRLRQVLMNLLSNAVKFTAEGEVMLEVNALPVQGEHLSLEFAVSDTGIGIAPDKQTLVFEPFAQADGTTTRKYGGTGLGLSISSRLVELMGGKIQLQSQSGMGSRFSFELQLAQDQQAETGARASYAALSGTAIGWVDSSKQRADWYSELLQRWQAQVATATSVTQAAALLSQEHFDILFIDDEMSPHQARPLVSAYRARNPASALVVLCRAYEKNALRKQETTLVEELTAAGESYMRLIKPVTPTELHEALQRALRKDYPAVRAAIPSGDAGRKSLRILLAEDNYVNQVLAVSVLEKLQHRVDIASDGQQALVKLEENEYDLVLMDVQMPHMGGLEVTHIWRDRERERGQNRLPIIAMTAHAMRGDQERCLRAGMDGYVSKPFQQMTLHAEIERVIRGEVHPAQHDVESVEPGVYDAEFTRAHALSILQNDDRLLERVAKVFLQAATGVCARLQHAAEHQDAESLRRAAHEVKGMAYNLGAASLAQSAARMEKLAKERKVHEALCDYDRLMDLFEAVTQVMREVASGSTRADP